MRDYLIFFSRKLKRERRKEQELNVEKKKLKKEQHRLKCLKGMGIDGSSSTTTLSGKNEEVSSSDDDDALYYKSEVGREPEEGKDSSFRLGLEGSFFIIIICLNSFLHMWSRKLDFTFRISSETS